MFVLWGLQPIAEPVAVAVAVAVVAAGVVVVVVAVVVVAAAAAAVVVVAVVVVVIVVVVVPSAAPWHVLNVHTQQQIMTSAITRRVTRYRVLVSELISKFTTLVASSDEFRGTLVISYGVIPPRRARAWQKEEKKNEY